MFSYRSFMCASTIAAGLLAVEAAAQEAFEVRPPDPVPKEEEKKVLGNAEPVTPGEWPATFIFNAFGGGCTSTAIGAQVLLTAAHCLEDRFGTIYADGTISVGGGEDNAKLRCESHPDYIPGTDSRQPRFSSPDFALCFIYEPLEGADFELLNTSIAFPAQGDEVTLLGYGCTEEGGFDRNFGVLHQGKAVVVSLPSGDNLWTSADGDAALCYGDSGGAAYIYLDSDTRFILGVNSRGDLVRRSKISSTMTRSFVDWARDWSRRNITDNGSHVRICGLHPDARGCRPV